MIILRFILLVLIVLFPYLVKAQGEAEEIELLSQPGIIITIVLIIIPILVAALLLVVQVNRLFLQAQRTICRNENAAMYDQVMYLNEADIDASRLKKSAGIVNEIKVRLPVDENKDKLLQLRSGLQIAFIASKKKALDRPPIDPESSRLIISYLGCAIFWLLFGTTVGEYVGLKFLEPDLDHRSWLSFGRLRPVHTNAVFWGWSSLAMIGLGYYVVSIISNSPIASLTKGWTSLILINLAVALGSLCLMAGVNNGGGEYREYIWPVMMLFGAGLLLTLITFLSTISRRGTQEIYISNWYMVSAIIFLLVIVFIAYWPTWQNGLGETIVQGYYMHQGVGMWFMLFTLGLIYYFLPQQLNKPIYSYSLGILAFWTQILFYTVIGTHHFVFSSIPWWLQTVAIVGSVGMVIPVLAGTTNFTMTLKGEWNKVSNSYTLPFFVVGIVFYFTGSLQGTAEAFRFTNLLWHFTDFTVAHSHLTMYGIIAFILWGSIYALVPRLTGTEPSHFFVGTHFWLAFIGLMMYTIPLMTGGTMRGLKWIEGGPFIESVSMMAPYWLWRAIGGTMMWMSHIFFAYNFYRMIKGTKDVRARSVNISESYADIKQDRITATNGY